MRISHILTALPEEHCWLGTVTQEFGSCRLEGAFVERGFVDKIRARAEHDGALARLRVAAHEALHTRRAAKGYLLLDKFLPSPENELYFTRAATILASLLGHPFHMVRRHAIWETLGADWTIESYRSGGIGYQPLHIDGVNATEPPDFLVLLCRRRDPAGGGSTLLSNLQAAVDELDETDRLFLQQTIFEEGEFYDLEGVGQDYRPFPVLTRLSDGLWRARVTGKMLPTMPPSACKKVLERFLAILRNKQKVVHLQPGQALVVNQLLNAHGRLALGDGQDQIPASERRDVRQGFLRAERSSFIMSSPAAKKKTHLPTR